jgi:hypothetical protein
MNHFKEKKVLDEVLVMGALDGLAKFMVCSGQSSGYVKPIKKVYVVFEDDGVFDQAVVAFVSKKKAKKYCKKHGEDYTYKKVKLK